MKKKIAILGAGASGLGTYSSLIKNKKYFDITIFNSSFETKKVYPKDENDIWHERNIQEFYKTLRNLKGVTGLNQKSNFGSNYNFIKNKNIKIADNKYNYGLTQFWGGVLQTFDDNSIKNIYGDISEFKNTYKTISNLIPVTKTNNNQNNNLLSNLSNKKEIKKSNLVKLFEKNLVDSTNISFGTSSIALTKDISISNECLCLPGCCSNHEIFSTLNFFNEEKNIKIVNFPIKEIDFEKRKIFFNDEKIIYDKIFINFGPYNSQKFIFENKHCSKFDIKVKDSYSFVFPILYLGSLPQEKDYFSLSNLIINFTENGKDLATLQIYPSNKHVLRTLLPEYLFKLDNKLYNLLFNRILFAKVFSNDENSVKKIFGSNHHNLEDVNRKIFENKIFNLLKKNLLKKNLFFLINYFYRPSTSAHYSGFDSFNFDIFNKQNNEIYKDIILNDSTLWNFIPSYSPTLSIIAYAHLLAKKNLNL